MTDRELMDKAWDYLASYTVGERPNASEVNDLVFALERRLAQPEHELVIDCPRCGHCCPQPEQEPVAYIRVSKTGHVMACAKSSKFDELPDKTLLYTATPQRQWVGLTDEDRRELAAEQHSWEGLCSAVETKLKEKNT